MNPAEFREVVWLLLLIPFGIVSGTGLFFLFFAWRKAAKSSLEDPLSLNALIPTAGFHPGIFEQPTRWLAVKAHDPAIVQAALKLDHPTRCSWEEGLNEAREDKLFISPAISGWVIVVGSGLPGPFDDVDEFFHFITDLSRQLGHVQYFSASRVVSQHSWALIERGHVFRAYAWAGQTLWNQGPMTAAEKDLNLRCFEYGTEQNYFQVKDHICANAERISQLAARWSLDPGAVLGARDGDGIIGGLSSSN